MEYLNFSEYHILDHIYLELLDNNNLSIEKYNMAGEIIVTVIRERLVPLLRYRVGDIGYFLNAECQCGLNSPVVKILGRSGDIINIASANFSIDAIIGE